MLVGTIPALVAAVKNLKSVMGDNENQFIEFRKSEKPGCYINHSCEPNIEEKERIG